MWNTISFSSIPKLELQNYHSPDHNTTVRFKQIFFYSLLVYINKPLVTGQPYFRDPACNKFYNVDVGRSDSKIFPFAFLATPTTEHD
jgi:hypothetical protein